MHARHVEYDIIKQFAAICLYSVHFTMEKGETHAFLFQYG